MTKASRKIIAAWIEKGDHDLGSAKVIFQYIPEYFDTIAFHCQQAVEKYLKALLIFHEIDFQRTHDLPYLLELLSRKIKVDSEHFDKAIILDGFAVEIRYPNLTINLSKEELQEAIEIAEFFRTFLTQQIKSE